MLDGLDWVFDSVAIVFLLLIVATLLVVVVWLGSLPGNIARKRAHPQADAVNVLGWLGLLFVPLWPLAMTWAFFRSSTAVSASTREDQR